MTRTSKRYIAVGLQYLLTKGGPQFPKTTQLNLGSLDSSRVGRPREISSSRQKPFEFEFFKVDIFKFEFALV